MVEAHAQAKDPAALVTSGDPSDPSLVLEVVEVDEVVETSTPVEVTEAVERPPAPPEERPPPARPSRRPSAADLPALPPLEAWPREVHSEMDMTPMVDVTFLLLIFFMVTATFTMQKSLEVPKPSDEDPSTTVVLEDPKDPTEFVTVRVDAYNTYHVLTVGWEREAPSEQDLFVLLREARHEDQTGRVPTRLLVEAHGDSLHEKVVSAIDAGTAMGFEEVQLTTAEDQ